MIAKSNRNCFRSISLFVLFIALLTINYIASAQTYGLKFYGDDVVLDKRTELNLSSDQFLSFHDEFEISFDYKMDLKIRTLFLAMFSGLFHSKTTMLIS